MKTATQCKKNPEDLNIQYQRCGNSEVHRLIVELRAKLKSWTSSGLEKVVIRCDSKTQTQMDRDTRVAML